MHRVWHSARLIHQNHVFNNQFNENMRRIIILNLNNSFTDLQFLFWYTQTNFFYVAMCRDLSSRIEKNYTRISTKSLNAKRRR